MKKNLDEITVSYGPVGDQVVLVYSDTTPDDIDCIIEGLEAEYCADKYISWLENVGRPRKFETVEDLYEKANHYFFTCKNNNSPLTVTGLCNALGTFRDVLNDYEDGKYGDEFGECVKHLKQIVEQGYEERLHGPNATGAIFALKNFGWKDLQGHELSGPNGGPIRTVQAALKDFTVSQLETFLDKIPG
jgi:hypothetical protein